MASPARLDLAPASREEETLRLAPHNLEAEQALLGAILVNNEAFDRVSDFLQPDHFYEALHGRTFEIIRKLLAAGKVATPITLKTYLPDLDLGGVTVPQYLVRLAANATTIINAAEYGRTIHDLATRRQLITIGEEMVNRAFDAPVEDVPRQQIEEAERKLYGLAESGRTEGGFQTFGSALTLALHMAS